MGFYKDYPNRKDWRKFVRRGGKAVCGSCRNHGACPKCQSDRQYQYLKVKESAKDQEKELDIEGTE